MDARMHNMDNTQPSSSLFDRPLPPLDGKRALRLGLTGGIGSGKSTVARELQRLGATVIDADAISRASTASGGSAIAAIRAAFGDAFIAPDGALERDRMRALVFSQPEARARLEAIVHPLVRAEIEQRASTVPAGQVAVLDLPLLVESGSWRQRVDVVWVVDCNPEVQIQRVMRRNGWPRAQVEAVLASQATPAERRAVADTVITNNGSKLAPLLQKVRQAWAAL
jgi:dephospho-CoA kinase